MKRFITVLSSLLVLPAFAEVAPVYYEEIVEYTDEMLDAEEPVEAEEQNVVSQKSVEQRGTINRSTSASRAISASGSSRTNTSSRAVASSPRNARTSTSRATVSRAARTAATRASVTSRSAKASKPVTARVGTSNNSVMPGNRTISVTSQRTLNDSGNSLYNPNTAARVSVGNRRATARASSAALTSASTTPVISEEDVSSTTSNLTAIAELTDYCKAQYAACMDNYCNVLDDNQGRCSCSKNIKNYAKTEAALADATEKFQEAVQKIKYIGLTGEQIETLFTETEAELTMAKTSDKSTMKTSLDSIKRKIIDVSTPNASSYEGNSGISFDLSGLLDADFTGGFDLNSFLNTSNSNTSSVSNQRGEQLFKTATNRCKTAVLNSCTAQGIDANVITNSYDLEIDKQCIAYERSLNEANKEMKNNVANATSILQQARLMLAQNRNSYDVRGCVAAIDSCMQDEYVCGSDYELCLDPTGKYLANGEIVKGGTPGVSGGMSANECLITENNKEDWLSNGMYELYSVWNYTDSGDIAVSATKLPTSSKQCDALASADYTVKNAWGNGTNETLGGYVDVALKKWANSYTSVKSTEDMATYLLQKIGYMDSEDKVHGMCASAMKQCQDYTYETKGSKRTYKANNEVVRQYLASALTKIKLRQDEILADYVEDCRSDVNSCLSTNGYDESNSASTISKTAINACRSEIQTCMSVGGWKPSNSTTLTLREMSDWVGSVMISCDAGQYVSYNSDTKESRCMTCPTNAKVIVRKVGDCTVTQAEMDSAAGLHPTGESVCMNNQLFEKHETYKYVSLTSSGGQVDLQGCACPSDWDHIIFTCASSTGSCTQGKQYHYCVAPAGTNVSSVLN